jgi:hypothetical protein
MSMHYELRSMSYEIWIMNYELRITALVNSIPIT